MNLIIICKATKIYALDDAFFMSRCLQLALLGAGSVSPNPMVGAVLVHEGEIIGEGYHAFYGGPHAEVNCIESVVAEKKKLISHARLFVSLEPCNHFGKTPPCTDLILQNKIPEVIIGCIDKNNLVGGKGMERLEEAGVRVKVNVLEDECTDLNKRFFTMQTLQRPYIILKWAQTVNGIIGDPAQRLHISNAYTHTLVHKWRSEEQSVLVGCGTAMADDPLLTNRYGSGRQPVKIVLCREVPQKKFRMFSEPGTTLIFNTEREDQQENVSWKKVNEVDYLKEVMSILFKMDIQSILVEGGAKTLQEFFDEGLWDECRIITNTKMTSVGKITAPQLPTMKALNTQWILNDMIQFYANPHNNFVVSHNISDYF